MADVPKPTLTRIAETHQTTAGLLSLETGIDPPIVSYALLRAMQASAQMGVDRSEHSARSVIEATTKIALRLYSRGNAMVN